jgi:hypothetical protein
MALASAFAFSLDPSWSVPIMGGACFLFAVLLGRRLLAGRPAAPPPAKEVELKSFLDGVTQDRRAAPRRKGNTVEVQLSRDDGPPIRGIVIDRSQGGLRVLVDEPVTEGGNWKIRPTTTDVTTPWTEVIVRNCRRDGAQFQIGCQFDRMPNWSLMLKFG